MCSPPRGSEMQASELEAHEARAAARPYIYIYIYIVPRHAANRCFPCRLVHPRPKLDGESVRGPRGHLPGARTRGVDWVLDGMTTSSVRVAGDSAPSHMMFPWGLRSVAPAAEMQQVYPGKAGGGACARESHGVVPSGPYGLAIHLRSGVMVRQPTCTGCCWLSWGA